MEVNAKYIKNDTIRDVLAIGSFRCVILCFKCTYTPYFVNTLAFVTQHTDVLNTFTCR